MTTLQSQIAQGVKPVPQAFTAGAVVAYRAEYTIPSGTTVATTDVIEMAVLPADHTLIGVTIVGAGFTTGTTAKVGLMSGEVGDDESARTCGSEIAAAADVKDTESSAKASALAAIAKSDTDRSIGLQLSASEAGPSKTVTLVILMTQ